MNRKLRNRLILVGLAVALLAPLGASAKDPRKIAVFKWGEITAYLNPPLGDEDRFHGPEGNAIRAKIHKLYEGMDDLDEAEYDKRDGQIQKLRRDLMDMRPRQNSTSQATRNMAIAVVRQYVKANGYDIAYSQETVNDKHYPVIYNIEMTDITQEVIKELASQGHGPNSGAQARANAE